MNCENCMNLEFDEETAEYFCLVAPAMDEDEIAKMSYYGRISRCPYYKIGDEYTIVRKQN